MTAVAVGAPGVAFVVLGNAPATLQWLRELLEASPNVRLIDETTISAVAFDENLRTGVVLDRIRPNGIERVVAGATRLVIVLADPVELLAEDDDDAAQDAAVGSYARVIEPLIRADPARLLVVTTDELAGSPDRVGELLAHLAVVPAGRGVIDSPSPSHIRSLTPGRRAVLFSKVRGDIEELEGIAGRTFPAWRFGSPDPSSGPSGDHGERSRLENLVYVGRRRDLPPPVGSTHLTDWDVLPIRMLPRLDEAQRLTILDPMSFPFEVLRPADRGIPLAVALPGEWQADELTTILGAPLLEQITAFDWVSIDDEETWRTLRERYSWPQRIRVTEARLIELSSQTAVDPLRRHRKVSHWSLSAAVRQELRAARRAIPAGEFERAILFARELEQWGPLFPLMDAELLGISLDSEGAEAAAESFPEWRFRAELPTDLFETVHIALSIAALSDCDTEERRRRLRRLWRGLRIGGRLIVVEQFLDGGGGRTIDAPAPAELLADVQHASARQVVLERLQALRLPGDELTSFGLFSFSRVGRPETL